MKTAIIYCSKHNGNTKKLLDAIKQSSNDEITLLDVDKAYSTNLTEYDLIGFASGIYFSKFDKDILKFAKENTPNGKDVFFIYTCGSEKDTYTKAIREAVADAHVNVLGEYGCLGYDTYGPFKLIGGIAKNHPDQSDLDGAVSFYHNLYK